MIMSISLGNRCCSQEKLYQACDSTPSQCLHWNYTSRKPLATLVRVLQTQKTDLGGHDMRT